MEIMTTCWRFVSSYANNSLSFPLSTILEIQLFTLCELKEVKVSYRIAKAQLNRTHKINSGMYERRVFSFLSIVYRNKCLFWHVIGPPKSLTHCNAIDRMQTHWIMVTVVLCQYPMEILQTSVKTLLSLHKKQINSIGDCNILIKV